MKAETLNNKNFHLNEVDPSKDSSRYNQMELEDNVEDDLQAIDIGQLRDAGNDANREQSKHQAPQRETFSPPDGSPPMAVPADSQQTEVQKYLGLKKGITGWNYSASCVQHFSQASANTFINIAGVLILISPAFYAVPVEDEGTVSGNLLFYASIYNICFDLIAGTLHDVLGRKVMIVMGHLGLCLSYNLYAHASKVFPNLLLVRLTMEHSLVCLFTTPLVPDYIKKESRGRSVAIVCLWSILGIIFGVAVFTTILKQVGFSDCFMLVGILYGLLGIYCIFVVKDVQKTKKAKELPQIQNKVSSAEPSQTSSRFSSLLQGFILKFNAVIHYIRTEPAAPICYIGGFLFKGGEITISAFLTLWISHFYERTIEDQLLVQNLSQKIFSVGVAVAIPVTFILSSLTDKIKFYILMPIAYTACALGLLGLSYVTNPTSSICYFYASIAISFGIACDFLCGILNAKSVKSNIRGALLGVYVFSSQCGTLVMSKAQGYAFDHHSPSSPFLIMAVLFFIFSAFVIFLRVIGFFKK